MEDKYWKDYTELIQITEQLTLLSPANLMEHYELLIEELEDQNKNILEWIYENEHEKYTRTKIQLVLKCDRLAGNLLLKEFRQKINTLDERMEKFIKLPVSENINWKENFSPHLIDWEKIKK